MIRCTNRGCTSVVEAHHEEEHAGWVWDWKTGWRCPEHFKKLKDPIAQSRKRHPSSQGTE